MSLTIRQRCAAVLRKLWFLQLADYLFFLLILFGQRKGNRNFRLNHPEVCVPPASIMYDILGTCDIAGFFLSGKEHASSIQKIICKSHAGRPLKILEWGCGPARVLQYLQSPSDDQWELFGSDYNPVTINWCRTNLPQINFFHNNLEPPLQAEPESFDVIYCISVFTHLSEPLHHQWIQEILRLLKPGGLFISTFHGNHYRDHLSLEEQKKFDQGEIVVRGKIREGKKNFATYHGDRFVEYLLSPFSSFWCINESNLKQSVWCALKEPKVGNMTSNCIRRNVTDNCRVL